MDSKPAEAMASSNGIESVDAKLTVMGGGEKEQASDFANCESFGVASVTKREREMSISKHTRPNLCGG